MKFKKSALIYIVFLFLFCTYSYNKSSNIPNGIRYKEVDSTTNLLAYNKILAVLEQKEPKAYLFDKAVGCYPFLWSHIKNYPYFDSAEGAKLLMNIGQNQILTGKAFRVKKDLDSLQSLIVELVNNDTNFIIRKLNKEELRIYWALIPFDIEEPLYIIESKSHKIVMHFLNNFVFQIEDLSDNNKIRPVPLDTIIDQLPDLNKEKEQTESAHKKEN